MPKLVIFNAFSLLDRQWKISQIMHFFGVNFLAWKWEIVTQMNDKLYAGWMDGGRMQMQAWKSDPIDGGEGGRGRGYMEGRPQPWKGEGSKRDVHEKGRRGCPSEWRAALKSMSALCDLWQDYYFAVNNFASAVVFVAHPSRISKEGEIVPRLSTTSHYWQGF